VSTAVSDRRLGSLRVAAQIAALLGAVGSVGLLWYAGRTAPRLLLVLFTLWVVSPYAVLLAASAVAKRWSAPTQTALYGLLLVVTLASLAIYATVAFGPQRARPAPFFVVVPPASWLISAAAVGTAAWLASRRSHR
jgi:hypothetical protein